MEQPMKIVLYAYEPIDYNTLRNFSASGFTVIAYGQLDHKYWFIFGEANIVTIPTEMKGKTLMNLDAFTYITIKAIRSQQLLNISTAFDMHIKTTNTDIQAEGIDNDSIVKLVDQYVEKRISTETRTVFWCETK